MGSKEKKNTAIYVAYDEYEPLDVAVPEKNLLRAILLTAMADLNKPGEPSRKANEYFLSQDEDYIFSFRSVCNYLNIDPHTILVVTGLTPPAEGSHLRVKTRAPKADEAEKPTEA